MRKIGLILIAMISILSIQAHNNQPATLTVRTQNAKTYILKIDNQMPIQFASQTAAIPVMPGNRNIQLFVVENYGNNHGYGGGYGHGGHKNRMIQRLVYNGFISVQNNSQLFASYNPRNGFIVENVFINNQNPHGQHQPIRTCGTPDPMEPHYNDNNYNGNNNSNYNNGNNGGYNYYAPVAMNGYDFSNLKNTISRQSFEDNKLQIIRQAALANNFTTNQVVELVNLFTFESYKLDVAKLMYAPTIDKQNYYVVNNAFTFSSSVSDLNNYLAQL